LADLIMNLVAKSLVSTQLRDGRSRYKLLEVTREYAAEKLDDSGETEPICRRHAVYFSRLEVDFNEVSVHAQYLGDVRAALDWCFSRPHEYGIGRELVRRATPVWLRLSLLAECHRWSERAIATLPETERGTNRELDLIEAVAICSMFTRGNDADVEAAIERGLQLAEKLGERRRQFQFLAGLNIFHIRVGDFAGALRSAEQASALACSLTEPAATLIAEGMLGVVLHLVGDQRAAQTHCETVLGHGDARQPTPIQLFGYDHRIRALVTLARTLWLRGAVDRAVSVAQQATAEAAALSQPVSVCISLIYAATVYLWRGDWLAAEEAITRGLAESRRHSLGPYHTVCLGLRGELLLRRGDTASGIEFLRRAFDDLTRGRHVVLAPGCGTALAEGLAATGNFQEALATLEQAIAQRDGSGASFDMPDMLRVKAQILMSQSAPCQEEAMACLDRALELARAQSALSWELRVALARVQMQPADADAREYLRAVRSRFTEGSDTVELRLADRLLE
jgi:tetratricopeptide (TPR) repeat protein